MTNQTQQQKPWLHKTRHRARTSTRWHFMFGAMLS